jgi:DUF1680 family protein
LISQRQRIQAAPIKNVTIENGLWGERQETNRNSTIPAISHQMKVSGRIDAWRLNWKPGDPIPPHYIFWDSDTGKWIEAIGFSLITHPNPDFEKLADEVIDLIEKAQHPDGYLNIFHTVVEPNNRWTNMRDRHELYDAGHLIEGAIAYAEGSGKTKFLNILTKYADYIDSTFGTDEGKKRGYCGHPEVELALVRLYHATGEKRYLNLSKYFIDERGQEPHYFDLEAKARGDDPKKFWATTYRYCQAHAPVRDQHTATGHSVRACYLYSGIADIVNETGDESLLNISREIWEDLTSHQMYITGGLGPAHANEGFTFAYDLPNETAYAETCASISLAFWAQRMFHVDPDSRYIDVMERALYNGILSGVSHEGSHFFYANPLASYPHVNPFERFSGINTAEHYRRSEWFDCPCCPPNLSRVVASIGSYMYSTTPDTLYIHLYNSNHAHFQLGGSEVVIDQVTNYPWDSEVNFTVRAAQSTQFDLALRIPDWCRDFHILLNGKPTDAAIVGGYAHLNRKWNNGDEITLSMKMPVERMMANPNVRHDAGTVALQRGPIVYCFEEVDNGARLANIALPHDSRMSAAIDNNLFGGIGVITGDAVRVEPANWSGGLYQPISSISSVASPLTFKAIPYYLWANREAGEMRVWMRES